MHRSLRVLSIPLLVLVTNACNPPNNSLIVSNDAGDIMVCTSLDLSSAPLVAHNVITGPPPVPTGGTVRDGTYALISVTQYRGSADAGVALTTNRRTLMRLQGDMFDVNATFPNSSFTYLGRFSTNGTNINFAPSCPDNVSAFTEQFTATDTELWLYDVHNMGSLTLETHYRKL